MPLILPGNVASAIGGGYEVANSCRFDGTSAYMSKTPGSNGDAQKFTTSCWFKKGLLAQDIRWLEMGDIILYSGTNTIAMGNRGFSVFDVYTNSNFLMDVAAWYHVVWAIDTTQSTDTNRVKIYVNGVLLTSSNGLHSSTSYMDQNANLECNQQEVHRVGAISTTADAFFDGYMAEFVHIDGTQYAASDFGEFDEDSPTIWKPKDVSGLTFGTNGFYLDFEASDNLGNDANGGTDLTETGLAATDQCTDTPTNNFCTLNPLTKLADATLSEGNTSVTYGTSSGRRPVFGTFAVSTGKWYFEMKCIATSQTVTEASFGFSNTFDPEAIGVDVHTNNGFAVAYRSTDQSIYTGTTAAVTSLGDMGVNDLFACVLDLDSGTQTLKIQKGGDESWNTASLASQTAGDNYPYWTPIVACSSDAQTFTLALNFGNPSYSLSSAVADANGYGAFEYAPPSGYFALCTKNLAEYG